jgi:glutamate synthase (ferredoxin)
LDPLSDEAHVLELKSLIENHYNNTLSPLAQRILEQWETSVQQFVRVLPEEYRQALIRLEEENLVKK